MLLTVLAAISCIAVAEGDYTVDRINVDVTDSGVVRVTESISFTGNYSSELSIRVPSKSSVSSIKSGNDPVSYDFYSTAYGFDVVTIQLEGVVVNSGYSVSLEYVTQDITSKNSGLWIINFSTSPVTPYKTIVRVSFPANSQIISWYSGTRFSPSKDALWLYPEETSFEFDCNYEVGVASTDTTLPGNNSSSGLWLPDLGNVRYVLLFVVLLVAVVLYVKVGGGRTKSGTESPKVIVEHTVSDDAVWGGEIKVGAVDLGSESGSTDSGEPNESVLATLDESERRIIDLILKSGEDEITQAFVYKTTGIPKATLSDIIRKMEKRHLIEISKEGRVNWIKINKKTFFK